MRPFLEIFGHPFPTYGLMAATGVVVSLLYLTVTARGKRAGSLPLLDVPHLLVLAVLGAIAGAKILFLLLELPALVHNWGHIIADPRLLLSLFTQGLVFYGGLLGGLLAVWGYCRRYALPLEDVLSVCTPAIPLFHVFGRMGCFLAGCCWGVPAAWGIAFPAGSDAPAGVPLFPVQLVESACNLALFVALAFLSRRLAQKWLVFPLYLAAYGLMRFTLEFFRGDRARGVFFFSTSQWISLLVVPAALLYMALRLRRQKNARKSS